MCCLTPTSVVPTGGLGCLLSYCCYRTSCVLHSFLICLAPHPQVIRLALFLTKEKKIVWPYSNWTSALQFSHRCKTDSPSSYRRLCWKLLSGPPLIKTNPKTDSLKQALFIFSQTQTICTEQGSSNKPACVFFYIYSLFASICRLLFAQLHPDLCSSRHTVLLHSQCLPYETGELHASGIVTMPDNPGEHTAETSAKIGTGMDYGPTPTYKYKHAISLSFFLFPPPSLEVIFNCEVSLQS